MVKSSHGEAGPRSPQQEITCSDLSLMTSPRHDEATTTPAVVAMTAWMEDTSLGKNRTH